MFAQVARSQDTDSDESSFSSSSSDSADQTLLQEIGKSKMASEWMQLLAFARDKHKSSKRESANSRRRSAETALPNLSPRPSMGAHLLPPGTLLQPTDAAELQAAGTNPESRSTTKEKRSGTKTKTKSKRAPSPLRPGVYVGHSERERLKSGFTRKRKPPPGISQFALPASREGKPEQRPATVDIANVSSLQEEDRPVNRLAASTLNTTLNTTWQSMVEMMEDSIHTDESKAYHAWRKKVIECAKTMQLEVGRFKDD
jgi:hypothetical protein